MSAALQRAVQTPQRRPGRGAARRSDAQRRLRGLRRDQKHDPGVGIIYVDPELKPTPPSASDLLTQAARAVAIRICPADGLDEPDLRQAPPGDRQPHLSHRRGASAARAQSRARASAAGGQWPLRHRQSAGRAALHVRERAGRGLDARRRRPSRPDRADADDECLHPLRRAQSLLEFAAGHHCRRACAHHPQGGPRLFHEEGLRARRSVRPTRTCSTRCRSTGRQSSPAGCRSICARSPGRRTRWAG